MQYVAIPLLFGFLTGFAGSRKGSSFLIWFVVGAVVPVIGLVAVLLSRDENDDPRRECPRCGKLLPIAAQVCLRCGEDLDYPDELIVLPGHGQAPARSERSQT